MNDQRTNHKVTQGLPHEGEVHEYQPDPQSTVEYLRSIAPKKKSHTARRVLLIIVAVLLVGAAAGGAYWKWGRKKAAPTPTASTTHQAAPKLITTETKHYSSSIFSLEFDYPKDWNVSESNGQLYGRSPRLQLKKSNGQSANGQVVFTIRDKNQTLTEFNNGNALAALESIKINYTKPSQSQRAATYLSFLRYTGNDDAKSMNGIYVTGDAGYQQDQYVPKADFVPLDPIISITFVTCGNQDCTGSSSGTPMAVASSEWSNSDFAKPLTNMITSLVVN